MFQNEIRDLGGIKIVNDSLVFVNDVDLLEILEDVIKKNEEGKKEIPARVPTAIINQRNENKYISGAF